MSAKGPRISSASRTWTKTICCARPRNTRQSGTMLAQALSSANHAADASFVSALRWKGSTASQSAGQLDTLRYAPNLQR